MSSYSIVHRDNRFKSTTKKMVLQALGWAYLLLQVQISPKRFVEAFLPSTMVQTTGDNSFQNLQQNVDIAFCNISDTCDDPPDIISAVFGASRVLSELIGAEWRSIRLISDWSRKDRVRGNEAESAFLYKISYCSSTFLPMLHISRHYCFL